MDLSKEATVACSLCEKKFSDEIRAKDHERQVHKEENDALRDLKEVNTMAHARVLDPNHREIVKKLETSVNKLHHDFKVPITPKFHIVFEHLPECFELKGKTLLKKSDQTIEATHSKFDKFVKVHKYQVRNVESDKAGENLLRAVKHFNSYNLGFFILITFML